MWDRKSSEKKGDQPLARIRLEAAGKEAKLLLSVLYLGEDRSTYVVFEMCSERFSTLIMMCRDEYVREGEEGERWWRIIEEDSEKTLEDCTKRPSSISISVMANPYSFFHH